MRRHGEPASILSGPAVSIAPRGLFPVRGRVACGCMDDRKIAHHANLHLMRFEIFDRHRQRGLLKKASAVDQRLVGIGTIEVVAQNSAETLPVASLTAID